MPGEHLEKTDCSPGEGDREPGLKNKRLVLSFSGDSIKETGKKLVLSCAHEKQEHRRERQRKPSTEPSEVREVLERVQRARKSEKAVPIQLFHGEANRICLTRRKIYDTFITDISSLSDTERPFFNYTDCYIRLLPYHLFYSTTQSKQKGQDILSNTLKSADEKIKNIHGKYCALIRKEADRHIPIELQMFEQKLMLEEEKFLHNKMRQELRFLIDKRRAELNAAVLQSEQTNTK
ncbi:MAG: uncharacterized protein A8A55_0934 [Amphiamblys sp. WSBS2006]|nr:MAG: uncharacterized protein A8A55_0934 [Amphiamblys sp. WSBS2006]